MFNLLQGIISGLEGLFSKKDIPSQEEVLISEVKSKKPKRSHQIGRDRSLYQKEYNERSYVKEAKGQDYLKNKDKYLLNRKRKRLLDRMKKIIYLSMKRVDGVKLLTYYSLQSNDTIT